MNYHQEYYQINKERLLKQQKDYYQKNKIKIAEQMKGYYQKNKGTILKRSKNYYQKNKEKINLRNRQYFQKNKAILIPKRREYHRKYQRQHSLTYKGKSIQGITKREYPKDDKCELCNNVKKHLAYHHWDDKDVKRGLFIKGIWVCSVCHHFIGFIDKYPDFQKYSQKYLNLKVGIIK